MLITYRIAMAIGTAIIFGAGAATVLAQPGQPAEPPAQAGPRGEVTDFQLELFARASEKVSEVQQEIQAEMSEAETAEEARRIQARAQERLKIAVFSFGMTMEEYNHISELLEEDPGLQKRLDSFTRQ